MKKSIIVSILTFMLVFGSVSCSTPNSVTPSPSPINPTPTNSTTKDNNSTIGNYIFVLNDTAEYLLIDTLETDGTAKDLVSKLISSKETNLGFPEGTELLNFEIKDNIAYIDLNDLYYVPYNYGATNGDTMYMHQIDSINASLFYNRQFGIDEIVYLREGKEAEYIGPLANYKYNYYDFDYNLILKENKYYNGGQN